MSVTGCLEDCAQAEINDVGMLPARMEDGTWASIFALAAASPMARGWPRISTSSSGLRMRWRLPVA